jgi:hypothetical protein
MTPSSCAHSPTRVEFTEEDAAADELLLTSTPEAEAATAGLFFFCSRV